MVIYSGFTHWKWWFSIVMLVYQRVCLTAWLPISCTWDFLMTRFLDHSLTIWTPFLQILTRFNDHFRNLNCRYLPYPTIYNPPDRKPRVAALTFVNNLFDAKCIKREVSAHLIFFLALFRGNSMVFNFFYHFVLWKWSFFCFASPKNRGCNECLWVIFPRLPVEIGTVQPRNTCCNCTAFCCSLQHVFAQIDVTPLPTA